MGSWWSQIAPPPPIQPVQPYGPSQPPIQPVELATQHNVTRWSRWKRIDLISAVLRASRDPWLIRDIYYRVAQEHRAHMFYVYPADITNGIVYATLKERHMRPLLALGIVQKLPGEDAHAVGIVADLTESDRLHYFDPNGLMHAGSFFELHSWLNPICVKIRSDIRRASDEGLVPTVREASTPYAMAGPDDGLQYFQSLYFQLHDVDYPGMCAIMVPLILHRWLSFGGRQPVAAVISDTITTGRWLDEMTDFVDLILRKTAEGWVDKLIAARRENTSRLNSSRMASLDANLARERLNNDASSRRTRRRTE